MTKHDEPVLDPKRDSSRETHGILEEQPEPPPPGVHAMALFRWALVGLMALGAGLSVAYSFDLISPRNAGAAAAQYYCPMHPQIVQDGPGACPICGMSLVPKGGGNSVSPKPGDGAPKPAEHAGHRHEPADPYYCPMHPEETGTGPDARCPICEMRLEKRAETERKESKPTSKASPTASSAPVARPVPAEGVPGLVPVELGLDRTQLIGVRTATATEEDLVAELRTVGFVAADESRIARVHTRFSGWVDRLPASTTGQKVSQGEVLASIYNPDLLPAQQEFLTALRWKGESVLTGSASLEQDARGRLELLGMSAREIDQIAATGKPTRSIDVSAPIGGYVVRKAAVQGAYVQPGTELFEIADLSRVWVLADIHEYEIARVKTGQAARVELSSAPGAPVSGKVFFIYPALDSDSRTLRVRIELANRNMTLRPGMYGDVVIQLESAYGVVIPAEALIDTGEYQYVFVAQGGGRFEPRRVRAGARSDNKAQILEGLAAGETVVTTANFMIDSESRLRAAIEGSPAPAAEATASSTCDTEFDATKFPDKHQQCRQCELVHRGMGTMEDDCKKAIPKPWR